MSSGLVILVTALLVATATGLLGPFLVLRRVALMSDAVSHAVLPGIVVVYLLFQTRAPLPVVAGAALFAIVCVLSIEWLVSTGLVRSDAAIGLVFPALFSLGVIGIQRYADQVHLDLDSTIYGEIAFAPFRTFDVAGVTVASSIVVLGVVVAVNAALLGLLWKELKATSFDPEFSRAAGIPPRLLSRLLLVAVAVTAVTAFESVGAILVITLFIVPAATAYLLAGRVVTMLLVTLAVGWASAAAGYLTAVRLDASIAGAMGLVAALCFAVVLVVSPRGLVAASVRRARRRRAVGRGLAASASR